MEKFCKEKVTDLEIESDGSVYWTVVSEYIDGSVIIAYWRTFETGCGLAYWFFTVGWIQKKDPSSWKLSAKTKNGLRREIRKKMELK